MASAMTSLGVADLVAAGTAALDEGDWERARALLERATASGGRDAVPEASEGLGWAGWWQHDGEATIAARETAYRGYRAAGDARGAARVALWVASDHRETRGDVAVGQGWLGRAARLLEPLAPCAEHGWLALHEGSFALGDGDAAGAATCGHRAVALGRALGSVDLEAIGLAQQGSALVLQGALGDGMARLDEASAIAHGEEFDHPVSLAWALCYLVSSCEGVGDFPRAIQWCDAMRTFAERWHGRQILGICRTSYGRVLTARGEWPAAESELTGALGDVEASRPGLSGTPLVRLGELRVRQGRVAEARALFARAGAHPDALVGLGALALAEGDAIVARDAAERILRRLPDANALDRLPALELRARALAALGDGPAAHDAGAAVRRLVDRIATPYLEGRAHACCAELAAASGDLERARRCAEDAIDAFSAAAAPYDAACARLVLAETLCGLGRAQHARAEAATARATFAALGAPPDVARADALLTRGDDAAPPPAAAPCSDLTGRELEVLRLVAAGRSDPEIAAALVVSPHTVHRHVANIRTKLRQPSRAAAVAHATRAGLL
jgi:ATP/maltotriose-dependent transcriptional regulator MalT